MNHKIRSRYQLITFVIYTQNIVESTLMTKKEKESDLRCARWLAPDHRQATVTQTCSPNVLEAPREKDYVLGYTRPTTVSSNSFEGCGMCKHARLELVPIE